LVLLLHQFEDISSLVHPEYSGIYIGQPFVVILMRRSDENDTSA